MALIWLFIALSYLLLYAFAAVAPEPVAILPPTNLYLATGEVGVVNTIDTMALDWLELQETRAQNENMDRRLRCGC
jgi:hypothetical protein